MENALAVSPAAPMLRSGKTSVVLMPASDGGPPVTGLARIDNRGQVVAIKTSIRLSGDQVWELRGRSMVTVEGYRHINKCFGLKFFNPENVSGPDGVPRSNPYRQMSPDGERLLWITQRKVGVWTNAVGGVGVYDYTLTFDLRLYLAQDMYAKWAPKGYKNKPVTPKSWGRLVPDLDVVTATRKANEKAYVLPEGSYLIVDQQHPDVVGIIGDHINRQKAAGALCDSFTERNILKKATGIGSIGKDGMVYVVSWQTPQDDVVKQLADLRSGEALASAMRGHDVSTERDTISDSEEINLMAGGENSEDDALPAVVDAPVLVAPGEPRAPVNPELHGLRAQIRELAVGIGSEEAYEALGQAGLDGLEEVGMCGDVELLKAGVVQLERAQLAKVSREQIKAKGKSPAAKSKAPGKLPLEGDSHR